MWKIYDKSKFAHCRGILFFISRIIISKIDPLLFPEICKITQRWSRKEPPRNGKDTRISVLLNPRRKIKAPSPQTRSVISISASISTRRWGCLKKQRAAAPPEGSWEHKREPVSRSKERQRGNSTLYICPALQCRPVNVFKPNMDRGNWVLSLRLNLGRGVR